MNDREHGAPGGSELLRDRVEWIERVLVRLGAFLAVGGLIRGSFIPWIEGVDESGEVTTRLGTLVFDLLSQPGGPSEEEVLIVISFGVFDLATAAAVALSLVALSRERTVTWLDKACAVVLGCCIAGAGLVTAMTAGRVDPSSTEDAVHFEAYVTWTLGALAAIWVLTRTQGGLPSPRVPHPAPEAAGSGEPSS